MEARNDIDSTAGDRSEVDGYERLRARALGGDADRWRLGLAVLQQRGVAAWLRVHRAATVANVTPPPPARVAPGIAGMDAELVGLLASMALAVAARG